MPHTIRLREPWEEQPLADGRVCLTRRFHRPTGLDASSRVWLVIEDPGRPAEVTLNGTLLGRIEPEHARVARFEIEADLPPLNVLAISLPSPPRLGGVRLEIAEGERGA